MDELVVLEKQLQEHKITQREYTHYREEIWNSKEFPDKLDPEFKELVDDFVNIMENPSLIKNPSTILSFLQSFIENVNDDGIWLGVGNLDERIACRTYMFKSGALSHFVSLYSKKTLPGSLAEMEAREAGACCRNFLETDRDRKMANKCSLADVILADIIQNDNPNPVGALFCFLAYEECRLKSTQKGIVQKLVSFLNESTTNEPSACLACLFSISCTFPEKIAPICPFLISYWNNSSLQKFEILAPYFIALTIANTLVSKDNLTENQITEHISFLEIFLKEKSFMETQAAECGYSWVNFNDFARLLHSREKTVYGLGIFAFGVLCGRQENRLLIEQQEISDFLHAVCMFPVWDDFRDIGNYVIQKYEWNGPPSLESITKHKMDQTDPKSLHNK